MKKILSSLAMVAAVFAANAAKVDTVLVNTTNLETPMKVVVVTPEGYAEGEKFPTAYVLHGYSGDYTDWQKHQPRINDMADRYGMIIVHPDGRDSWYIDSPVNPKVKMESFFVEDLVPFIDKNYPTKACACQRAITGLSMGGHGAMFLAMRHPDIWKNVGSMSGGVDVRPFPNGWNIPDVLGRVEEHPENWENYAAINQISRIKPGDLNINFDCGIDDFFAEVNENLHKALVEAKIPHDYTSRPGAHTWEYWNNSILHHLLYFSEAFREAGAAEK